MNTAQAVETDSPPAQPVGSALTIVLPVVAQRVEPLSALLNDIGLHIQDNPHVDFGKLALLHFARWVVIPPAADGGDTQLAFESNYDGTVEQHLDELLRVAPDGMHAIYRDCVGYPLAGPPHDEGARARLIAFLLKHALPYAAFYVAVPGASARQIQLEAQIRARIEAYLGSVTGAHGSGVSDPLALCEGALQSVLAEPKLAAALAAADDSTPLRPLRLIGGALTAIAASPLLIPALLAIRLKELGDVQSKELTISDSARELMAREDLQIQNQLTHVVPLRSGRLRLVSTRVVLKAIDFLAHELFTRGNLGGISSIHFARWVLIDEGDRLLFFSNYDGSWESYLGDFIDKAALGLTAVWSNTRDFPKTVLLLFKGATDEERFKAWTRAHQVPSQLWYSAYPALTVRNVISNRKLCAELRRGLRTRRAAERWLQRL